MGRKKHAIIDIDNTLWHFCDMLHEQLLRINPSFPPTDEWIDWDFWQHFCSESEFMNAIHHVHFNQDDEKHMPYPEAQYFLQTLRDEGFHLTIASHRSEASRKPTERWLYRHGLPFHDLHLSFNKAALFEENCCVVVDDAPMVLEKAKEKGLISAGLLFPWNRLYRENGFVLFDNLNDILRFVLGKYAEHA